MSCMFFCFPKPVRVLLKIAAVFLGLLLFLRLLLPGLYFRFGYFGSRISGTIRVEVDGEAYPLQKDDFVTVTDHEGSRCSVRTRAEGSARVAIRGGDYGLYCFRLQLDGLEQPITIGSYQFNWWNVTRFALVISIDRAAGTIRFESEAKELNEAGRWRAAPHAETAALSQDKLEYWVVSI